MRPSRVLPQQLWPAILLLTGVIVTAILVGPVSISPTAVGRILLDWVPGLDLEVGYSQVEKAIIWELRIPRIILGVLVGAILAGAGASYQGVFANPLADPYLLGVAAGAGLGATVSIVSGAQAFLPLPVAAFLGAVLAVSLTYLLGRTVGERSASTLILSGVAVAAFFTATQTFVQQNNTDNLREVYGWLLGRLGTAGWSEVVLVLPYVLVSGLVMITHRRWLDVLAVGQTEANTLGAKVSRLRLVLVLAATLGTAAAVAVSGLIGFVGIVIPHILRLIFGVSYRIILPLSFLGGAAFLVGADLIARTVVAPAELPIGVVTAFFGAPFFILILRRQAKGISL